MRLLTIVAALTVFLGCSDFPDPANNSLESYYFANSGQNQKAFTGEYLRDSLMVTIIDNNGNLPVPGFQVHFEVADGNGEVDQQVVTTDAQGNAFTYWRLGESGNDQALNAQLFNGSGKYLATIPFKASAFHTSDWNTTALQPDINFTDLAADTLGGVTFAVAINLLYRQGERYFDWDLTTMSVINNYAPRRIILHNDRTFYVGTWYGQLFRSTDQGASWQECSKPWPDHSYYFHMNITKDNYIWVTAAGKPLRCSRDGGVTWTTDSTGLPAAELLGDIFRLSDGTYFFHSLNCNLSKSTDDGHTWNRVNAPEYSVKLYVTENDELILFNQEGGISIFKSTDKGEHFTKKHTVAPLFGTLMDHTIHKRGKDYYIMIPGYGILHTRDFETYTTYWRNTEVNDMFMDDEGVIIAREWLWKQVHYKDSRE